MRNNIFYQPPGYNNTEQANARYQAEMFYKNKRRIQKHELIKTGLVIGGTLVFSLIIEIFAVLGLQLTPYYSAFNDSTLFQYAFNIIAVDLLALLIPFSIMSLVLRKQYEGNLIPNKALGKLPAFAWVSFGMGCCVVANFIAAFVISLFKQFGYKLIQPEYNDPTSAFECVVIVASTAIAPAIFEEFAMRCCTLGALRKYGKGFAVFAVSIVFGLIHQNVIQFVFAFCVGLIVGYVTVVTDSVIPAMFIHGLNNSISVTNTIVKFAGLAKAEESITPAMYILWSALGIWGAIYLIMKKKLIPKRQNKLREPYSLSFGEKLLCLVPGFFIPFIIMVYFTTQSIVPIK